MVLTITYSDGFPALRPRLKEQQNSNEKLMRSSAQIRRIRMTSLTCCRGAFMTICKNI
jgi:hypothetical protein